MKEKQQLSNCTSPRNNQQTVKLGLYDRLLPSPKIRRHVRELHENIDRAGFILGDVKADNYVVNSEGKVYLIDCGFIYPKSNSNKTGRFDWKQKRITTCKFEEWLEILVLSFTEGEIV